MRIRAFSPRVSQSNSDLSLSQYALYVITYFHRSNTNIPSSYHGSIFKYKLLLFAFSKWFGSNHCGRVFDCEDVSYEIVTNENTYGPEAQSSRILRVIMNSIQCSTCFNSFSLSPNKDLFHDTAIAIDIDFL